MLHLLGGLGKWKSVYLTYYVLFHLYQLTSCLYVKFALTLTKIASLTSDYHSPHFCETWLIPWDIIAFECLSAYPSLRIMPHSLRPYLTNYLNSIIHLTCLAKKCLEIVRNCHSESWHEVMSTPSKQFSEHTLCQHNLF